MGKNKVAKPEWIEVQSGDEFVPKNMYFVFNDNGHIKFYRFPFKIRQKKVKQE